MEIQISQEAEQDLIEIFDYVLQDNPSAAENILDIVYKEIHYLSDHPFLGRPGRVPNTRRVRIKVTPNFSRLIQLVDVRHQCGRPSLPRFARHRCTPFLPELYRIFSQCLAQPGNNAFGI